MGLLATTLWLWLVSWVILLIIANILLDGDDVAVVIVGLLTFAFAPCLLLILVVGFVAGMVSACVGALKKHLTARK